MFELCEKVVCIKISDDSTNGPGKRKCCKTAFK